MPLASAAPGTQTAVSLEVTSPSPPLAPAAAALPLLLLPLLVLGVEAASKLPSSCSVSPDDDGCAADTAAAVVGGCQALTEGLFSPLRGELAAAAAVLGPAVAAAGCTPGVSEPAPVAAIAAVAAAAAAVLALAPAANLLVPVSLIAEPVVDVGDNTPANAC